MFKNPRYLTIGVQTEIPLMVQTFIWNCIDRLPSETDYLQVFKLSAFGDMQQIIHESEEPAYKKVYLFPSENPITENSYAALIELCGYFGVDEEDVMYLYEMGYSISEIEEFIMNPHLLDEIYCEGF